MRWLFTSAIRLLNRLRFPQKFAVIGILIALPTALLLYFFFSEVQERIQFTRIEMQGNAQLRDQRLLLEAFQQYEATLESRRSGLTRPDLPAPEILKTQIERQVETLGFASNHVNLPDSDPQRPLHHAWLNLKEAVALQPKMSAWGSHSILRQELISLGLNTADRSRMILDMDLDSHYMIDTLVNKLPMIMEDLAQLRLREVRTGGRYEDSPESVIELRNVMHRLLPSLAALRRNLSVALTANPALRTELQPVLDQSIPAMEQVLILSSQQLDQSLQTPTRQDADVRHAASQALRAAFVLYDKLSPTLDELLQVRFTANKRRLALVLLFIQAVAGIVTYLFIAFYLAVMHTVSALDTVSTQLSDKSFSDVPRLDEIGDELGRVVNAFTRLGLRLRQECEQAQLESARALAAESALALRETHTRAIIDTALDAVISMDTQGRIVDWNCQGKTCSGGLRRNTRA
jgi:PAS domain-containing protein